MRERMCWRRWPRRQLCRGIIPRAAGIRASAPSAPWCGRNAPGVRVSVPPPVHRTGEWPPPRRAFSPVGSAEIRVRAFSIARTVVGLRRRVAPRVGHEQPRTPRHTATLSAAATPSEGATGGRSARERVSLTARRQREPVIPGGVVHGNDHRGPMPKPAHLREAAPRPWSASCLSRRGAQPRSRRLPCPPTSRGSRSRTAWVVVWRARPAFGAEDCMLGLGGQFGEQSRHRDSRPAGFLGGQTISESSLKPHRRGCRHACSPGVATARDSTPNASVLPGKKNWCRNRPFCCCRRPTPTD